MIAKMSLKLSVLVAAAAFSNIAAATVTDLTGQYSLQASAVAVAGQSNEYVFNYTVTNIGQGYLHTQTGLDGFTVYIPTSATVLSAVVPTPYAGSPGFWSHSGSPSLSLGGNGSQDMVAPTGYQAYTFWGQNTESVYQQTGVAHFSLTLGNVSVGTNTVGISSYYGFATPPTGQEYVSNQWGNYTTFTTQALSAVTAVPEQETYAMMLAGLGLMGAVARRRRRQG
jgi:MYXO-CTERM domain-containing protein